jgi:hypothetical protein
MHTKNLKLCLLALLAGCAVPAWADTSWTFTCVSDCNTSTGTFGNTRTATADNIKVTASAFSNTYSTGNTILQTAYLSYWGGGLGVTNRDRCTSSTTCGDYMEGSSPEHAIDNNQRYDSVLFSFTDAGTGAATDINLTQVALGWFENDADISVFAYTTGTGKPDTLGDTAYLANGSTTYSGTSGLLNKGWELVGNYADVQAWSNDTAILGTGLVSSYWLVMTYNSAFGPSCISPPTGNAGNSPGCTNGYTSHYDYVKLAVLGGKTTNGTPEPGSMVLFGTVLAGLTWMRRKKSQV